MTVVTFLTNCTFQEKILSCALQRNDHKKHFKDMLKVLGTKQSAGMEKMMKTCTILMPIRAMQP